MSEQIEINTPLQFVGVDRDNENFIKRLSNSERAIFIHFSFFTTIVNDIRIINRIFKIRNKYLNGTNIDDLHSKMLVKMVDYVSGYGIGLSVCDNTGTPLL